MWVAVRCPWVVVGGKEAAWLRHESIGELKGIVMAERTCGWTGVLLCVSAPGVVLYVSRGVLEAQEDTMQCEHGACLSNPP